MKGGEQAPSEFVQRAVRGSRSSAGSATRMVNAAVYRYEHEVPEDRQDGAADTPESTEDERADRPCQPFPGSGRSDSAPRGQRDKAGANRIHT